VEWIVWGILFVLVNLPIATLLLDRIFGVPAPQLIRFGWLPGALVLIAVLAWSAASRQPVLELVVWGAVGGFFATVALDIVRLIGLHVFRAFPVDMPQVFGVLALGLGPHLQENVIAAMVRHLADEDPEAQQKLLAERLLGLARLPEPVRVAVIRAMRKGLASLPAPRRHELMATQMSVLATLPSATRQTVMQAMDLAMADPAQPVYQQPRSMPKVPMHTAHTLLAQALPQTLAEAGVPHAAVLLAGYGWHLLNGLGFGVTYTLLFGHGTWALALAWGLFIWAGMMVTMPIMMPTIRFPMPGFLVVPFIAHVVMAGPIGYFAFFVSREAHRASLVGRFIP
jgi:hypothetical protein